MKRRKDSWAILALIFSWSWVTTWSCSDDGKISTNQSHDGSSAHDSGFVISDGSQILPPSDSYVPQNTDDSGTIIPPSDTGTTPSDFKQPEQSTIGMVCKPPTKPGDPNPCYQEETCVPAIGTNMEKGTCWKNCPANTTDHEKACTLNVAGKNYSKMCFTGSYWFESEANKITYSACALLCEANGNTYDCPDNHSCNDVKGSDGTIYKMCVPN